MKEYEVWMEGFRATGESSGAVLLGKANANSFAAACHIVNCTNYLESLKKEMHSADSERWDYDPKDLSCWGCRLFESESQARKAFG